MNKRMPVNVFLIYYKSIDRQLCLTLTINVKIGI